MGGGLYVTYFRDWLSDVHGSFKDIKQIKKFCKQAETTKDDALIVLGDLGANYWLDERDHQVKEALQSLPITILAIHGNHEERPSNISSYQYCISKKYGALWYEYDYPNIYFLEDGEHIIDGKRFLVASGAYSVDKKYRLATGKKWFSNEQMSEETKNNIRTIIKENNSFDYILSHTAPLNYEPRYLFLPQIDQSEVDKSMEIFLQEVYNSVNKDTLKYHLFGHYHDDNLLDTKVRLMFNDIIELE